MFRGPSQTRRFILFGGLFVYALIHAAVAVPPVKVPRHRHRIHMPEIQASSSQSCRTCHTRIYEEWSRSSHAQAFVSPLFQAKYRSRGRPGSCLRCHAPEPIYEHVLGRAPPARSEHRSEGVSCLSCHRQGEAQIGPHRTPDAAHPSREDASLRSVAMCASCHDAPCECSSGHGGQLHDYLHAPQRARETCQSCHMPEVFASSVDLVKPKYPARKGRSHFVDASRDPDVLRMAVRMDGAVEGRYFYLSLENATSGHRLPGGPERALIAITRFTDKRNLEIDRVHEYLHAQTKTRLKPAERRDYRYLLKPHYEGVETKLYYRLFEKQAFEDWILLERIGIRLDGKGPLPEAPSHHPNQRPLPPRPETH